MRKRVRYPWTYKTVPLNIEEKGFEGEKKGEARVIGFAGRGGVGKTRLPALFLKIIPQINFIFR